MKLIDLVRKVLYADQFVIEHNDKDHQRMTQRELSHMAVCAFGGTVILNLVQQKYALALFALFCTLVLMWGCRLEKKKQDTRLLQGTFFFISVVLFTAYLFLGTNQGFSLLWGIIATYAVMMAVDLKIGFFIGVYQLALLLLTFWGPLRSWLLYDYGPVFRVRFPFLFATNLVFASYIIGRFRLYQYQLLLKQQELEYMSDTDLSTGLKNRNCFIRDIKNVEEKGLESLQAVFVDVNGLHEINNRAGHETGDRVIRFIADRCRAHFPENDIYRMGGDEFLILCRDAVEEEVRAETRALCRDVEAGGCSVSYGIESGKGAFDLNEMVRNADEKMILFKREYYRTKREQTGENDNGSRSRENDSGEPS